MTSSLRSRFNISPRRALLLASDTITVYHWQQGGITHSFAFDNDDSGLAFFARYLTETLNVPLYVLVDMVEEEFRQDTIPHVSGPTDARYCKGNSGGCFEVPITSTPRCRGAKPKDEKTIRCCSPPC